METAAPRRAAGTGLALFAAAVACGAVAAALALRVVALTPTAPGTGPDDLVELGLSAVGAAVLGWLAVSAAVAAGCLALRAAGRSWRSGEAAVHRFAPVLVRRTLAVAVAAGLGLGSAGVAMADDGTPTTSTPAAASVTAATGPDLGWVVSVAAPSPATTAAAAAPSPTAATAAVPGPTAATAAALPPPTTAPPAAAEGDRPTPPAATTASSRPTIRSAPAAPVPDAPGTVTVRQGDTLWAIAARHLGPDASDAQIAAAWPVWYASNALLVGPDPDLILPGQVLTVPAGVAR